MRCSSTNCARVQTEDATTKINERFVADKSTAVFRSEYTCPPCSSFCSGATIPRPDAEARPLVVYRAGDSSNSKRNQEPLVTERNAALTADYHFVREWVALDHWSTSHSRVLELLDATVNAGAISRFENHERMEALPQNDGDKELLTACR